MRCFATVLPHQLGVGKIEMRLYKARSDLVISCLQKLLGQVAMNVHACGKEPLHILKDLPDEGRNLAGV
jgi:hypothetical protein